MKNLKLFAIAIIIGGLAGCISIGSKQPDKTTEKERVIVVPEKNSGDTGY
jgi:hypothetical protein